MVRRIETRDGPTIKADYPNQVTDRGDHLEVRFPGRIERVYKTNITRDVQKDCFLATGVYGDPDAPEVQVLREFRDERLRRTLLGCLTIETYYSGVGKSCADFIEDRLPSAIPAIRRSLDWVVKRYQDSKERS